MAILNTIPSRGQEPFKIRAKVAMARTGITVTEIAKRIGCARVTASEAINHGMHHPTRQRIASLLGIKP